MVIKQLAHVAISCEEIRVTDLNNFFCCTSYDVYQYSVEKH